ncbi:MAG: acyl-CoA thioesterase/bile acid-CoA:amino acid N-acyltransferase family protein [Candidatus Babeliales bacterium]
MKTFFILLIIFAIILLGTIFWKVKKTPQIHVSKQKALIDEPIEISVLNLTSYEQITLESSCKDKKNNTWLSHATFQADDKGVVNVATQAPISGSYKIVDPMGLFWSMISTDKEDPSFSFDKNELEISLSVFSQNKLITQKKIYRLIVSPDIEKRQIREQGIVGTLFYHKNMKKNRGIIVIPGSDGGIPEKTSQLLASHGYTVLALGYFGLEELPKNLENIPLEYFQNAMHWLKNQPQVDKNYIALWGQSFGGTLVLLLAAMFPKEISAVISYVPSNIVYGAFPQLNNPCWIYKNSPIPFIPCYTGNGNDIPGPNDEEILNATREDKIPFHKGTFEDPMDLSSVFLYGMDKFHQRIEAATIPLENIQCPILMISGEDDKVWPSTLYCNLVMERLNKKKSIIERKHLHFPDAGHGFLFPYFPSSAGQPIYYPMGKFWVTLGGTAQGNALAAKKAWQETLNFLQKNIKRENKDN